MTEAIGEVRFLALEGMDPADYEYNYMIGGEGTVDPYARGLAGRDIWGKERGIQKHEVRGVLKNGRYDWGGGEPLKHTFHSVVA